MYSGNYFADQIREELGADIGLLLGSAIRSDRIYKKGHFTLGDLLSLFPSSDTVIATEMNGDQVWKFYH